MPLAVSADLALPLDLVTEATAIVATRGAGKSSASAVIAEEAFTLGVQTVIFDRTGVYWGLRSNRKGTGPGLGIYVLGGPHGDVPLDPHAGVLIADLAVDSGHSFVLDLSDLSKSGAIRFAADFLERLYDRKARARTTTLVVMDEAHFYAPQTPRGGFKGDSARLMGAMEDMVGLGRSRGLGVVLTTQRTQSLNKAILDLIETLIVMRMLSPRAREAVKGWISEKHEEDQGVLQTLDSLPDGTAWVWSPLRGILKQVALRRIRTFDSFATPKPGETRAEPTARKQLDLAALGEQMRVTAERAKENDPADLRRRLITAEKEIERLREAAAPVAEQVEVEVRVPIPFVPEEAKRAVADARAALDAAAASLDVAPPAAPAPAPPGAPARAAPVRPAPTSSAGPLGTAAQRFLDTLARHYPVTLSISQMAVLSGRKARGGSFNSAMRELRDGGYVDDDGSGVFLTEKGINAAGVKLGVPRSPAETIAMWEEALPAAAREIFALLAQAPGSWIDYDAISARTGRMTRGGSWNSAIKTLTTNGLVDRDGSRLKVADSLFLSAAA